MRPATVAAGLLLAGLLCLVPDPSHGAGAQGAAEPETTGTGIAPVPADEPPPAPQPDSEPDLEPDRAAQVYLSRCAGCHTIGGGELSGPDLEPSTGWPEEELTLAVERMEKNAGPMTDQQVQMLVDLLKAQDVQQRLSAAREAQVREMAATLEPPSPARGGALFHGGDRLRGGGLPCSACHRAGKAGGTLAADLTDAASRMGEAALLSAAETPGFPLMKAAYADHPVTRQEAVHVTAYLQELARQTEGNAGAAPAPPRVPVGWWGSTAAAVFLIALTFLYRGRVRGVRAPLVREGTRR